MLRVPVQGLREGMLQLPSSAAHYVLRVHRLRVGERLVLFDPQTGGSAEAVMLNGTDPVTVRVEEIELQAPLADTRLCWIQALGKGDRTESVVQDATELGVDVIWLVRTERTVVNIQGRVDNKLQRWMRVAQESARQCGRSIAPEVGYLSFREALEQVQAEQRIVLTPDAPVKLRMLLERPLTSVAFAVGPEGGFSPGERVLAAQAGWLEATLGSLVLRTETVAAAVLGAWRIFRA